MKAFALLLVLQVASFPLWTDAAAFLEGVTSPEELDSETFDRYEYLAAHPLDLNSASLRELMRSALFDEYRAACIDEYRRRCGPIASYTELSAVDGIGEAMANALRPFTRLDVVSASSTDRLCADAALRSSLRSSYSSPDPSGTAALKGGLKYGRYEFDAAFNSSAPQRRAGVCLSSDKVYLGDFNARFGRGLGLWSGTSLGSLRKASAYCRSASGISPCRSWSGAYALRGAAFETDAGPFVLSAFAGTQADSPGLLAGANARFLSRRGTYGLTYCHRGGLKQEGVCALLAADAHVTLGHFGFWGELALSGAPAFVAGVSWYPAYGVTLAGAVRNIPSLYCGSPGGIYTAYSSGADERGASLALDAGCFSITSDAALRPESGKYKHRAVASYKPVFDLKGCGIGPELRCALNWSEAGLKQEYRGVLSASFAQGLAKASLRADFVTLAKPSGERPEGRSLSATAELKTRLTLILSGGVFATDGYDGRVYIYERDIPGSFNVPAYYGTGWHCSLYAAWKCLYIRAGYARLWEKGVREDVKLGLKIRI
ncbi:MAG: helix-hairpin-helix domain-containing protein [Bacteroidales bacterium]|nr:helix-hairpin-helix domain-containing protein [Candidatus Cryptobacteroides aphodequi]